MLDHTVAANTVQKPMLRIAIPALSGRKRLVQRDWAHMQRPARADYRAIFAADLKPFGSMDFRLTSRERRNVERTHRLRAALYA